MAKAILQGNRSVWSVRRGNISEIPINYLLTLSQATYDHSRAFRDAIRVVFVESWVQVPININCSIADSAAIRYPDLVNLYGCTIGDMTSVGPFVEIQEGVVIGRSCKIQSHSMICEGVTIEDNVFVGHGVMFTNDKFPRSTNEDGSLQTKSDWTLIPTLVKTGASIGTGVTVLPGVTIGRNATIGAGSVVTHDVDDFQIVYGNPATCSENPNEIQ